MSKALPKCKVCGKTVKERRRTYCSLECQHEAQKKYIVCQNCGKTFNPKCPGRGRKFCSRECYNESLKGKIPYQLREALKRPRPREWVVNQAKSRSKYAKIPKEKMRELFEDWIKSRQPLPTWIKEREENWIRLGIRRWFKRLFPGDYEAHVERQFSKSKLYQKGRQFEYRVRNHFREKGYWVLRSPASRGPADLVAIKEGEILLIQCKIGGAFTITEKEKLCSLALSIDAKPILVYRGPATQKYPLRISEPFKEFQLTNHEVRKHNNGGPKCQGLKRR